MSACTNLIIRCCFCTVITGDQLAGCAPLLEKKTTDWAQRVDALEQVERLCKEFVRCCNADGTESILYCCFLWITTENWFRVERHGLHLR